MLLFLVVGRAPAVLALTLLVLVYLAFIEVRKLEVSRTVKLWWVLLVLPPPLPRLPGAAVLGRSQARGAGMMQPRARRPRKVVLGVVAAILLVALVASRTIQRQGQKVDQRQAIVIAEKAAGIDADQEVVRFLRTGVQERSHWAVALSMRQPDGSLKLHSTVLIDATSGQVVQLTPAE